MNGTSNANLKEAAVSLLGFTIFITRNEYDELKTDTNKEYVAGFLIGRAIPKWLTGKKA